MSMSKKTLVVIHVMPHEIFMFKRFMERYRKSLTYCKNHDVTIRATLNLNPNLIDWDNSTHKPEFFIDMFNEEFMYDGFRFVNEIVVDDSVKGTSDQKRKVVKGTYYDQFLFVDPDIVFHEHQLVYMLEAGKDLNGMYMVSPNVPKFWDNSWDVLVHKDMHDVGVHSDEAINNVATQKIESMTLGKINTFKFGCGLFNLFSKEFWHFIGIPESIGGYGPEDTIAATRAFYAAKLGYDISQYLLAGAYVTESKPQEEDIKLKDGIAFKTEKDFTARKSKALIEYEVLNFVEKIQKK